MAPAERKYRSCEPIRTVRKSELHSFFMSTSVAFIDLKPPDGFAVAAAETAKSGGSQGRVAWYGLLRAFSICPHKIERVLDGGRVA
jgi:hypothetical protein